MFKRALIAFALVACSAQSGADGSYEEGVHYDAISPAVSSGEMIEVVEVFSYACVHCATFDPFVHEWSEELPEGVKFTRMPAAWSPSWEPFARAYYAAEMLGVLEESHDALFQALHTERKPLRSVSDLASFYAQYGVDEQKFIETANGFAVDMKVRRSKSMVPRFGVGATPTMVVNGKYRLTGSQAGGYEEMIQVVNSLVEKEKLAMAAES